MSPQENELITRTGPDTTMGNLFRSYWIPALLAEELPEPDCPPVRIKLLSERLLAFRDREGKLGLIDEFCAHRGVSLWFGRNEEGGLRCPYHGWKYDVTGQCIDVPSESVESGYAQKIKLKAYPLIELGGVLWTYMGPPERQPPTPEYEFATVPREQSYMSKRIQECNWLQAMEGGVDPTHVAFLHKLDADPMFKGAKGNLYTTQDAHVVLEAVETDGGMLFAKRRNAEEGHYYWRVSQWVMPCFTAPAPRGDHPPFGHFWIPMDDENCWTWSYNFHPTRKLTETELKNMRDGKGIHAKLIPGTFRPVQNIDNDYWMDRQAQKEGRSFSGVPGFGMQDAAVQESQGVIADRSRENLTASDNFIILARRRLLKAAKALQQNGTQPPGIHPITQRVRSAAIVLPFDVPFIDALKGALKVCEGTPHETV